MPKHKISLHRPPAGAGDEEKSAAALKTKRPATERVEAVDLDPGLIDASPFQPRQSFPVEEINALAESITANGQIQPITVRRKPRGKRFELLDGERRLRACQRLRLPAIRAEVQQRSDAEARAIVLVAALQRQALGAIEEANAFKAALDAGDAAGPTELAAQLGLSQGHVSNRLRLLKLPASIRRRVISQEIPATHAREIVRYADHPRLLAAIGKEIDQELKHFGELPAVKMFREETLGAAVCRQTKPMGGNVYDRKTGRHAPVFEPSGDEAEQLGLVESRDGEWRASNVKLWERLQAKHAKAWQAKQAKAWQAKQAKKGKAKAGGGNGKPKKLTPAEAKAAAEAEKRKARERAELFRRRLADWRVNWQRYLIAEELLRAAHPEDLLRVAILFAARHLSSDGVRDVHRHLKANGVRAGGYGDALFGHLAKLEDPAVPGFAAEVLAGWFYDNKEGPRPCVDAETVQAIARQMGIDLENAWAAEQAGPLSEAYWDLHGKDQLVALGKELGVPITASMKKADAVKRFLAEVPAEEALEAGIAMPKELRGK